MPLNIPAMGSTIGVGPLAGGVGAIGSGASSPPSQGKGQPQTGGNPAFQGMVERSVRPMRREFLETTIPALSSNFARGGRFPGAPTGILGGGLGTMQDRASDTFMRNVGDVTSGLAYRTYGDERQNMMQALGMAPQFAQQDYFDIGKLREVGQAREQQSSAILSEQMARHAFEQQEPRQRLEDYMRNITGSFGGTSTTMQPGGAGFSPLLALLGGGALGVGASQSKPTVICTEAHRQGYFDDMLLRADQLYADRLRDRDPLVVVGYQIWGYAVARAMRRHQRLGRFIAVLARPVAMEMAARAGHGGGSRIGKLALYIGLPVCRLLGTVRMRLVVPGPISEVLGNG